MLSKKNCIATDLYFSVSEKDSEGTSECEEIRYVEIESSWILLLRIGML